MEEKEEESTLTSKFGAFVKRKITMKMASSFDSIYNCSPLFICFQNWEIPYLAFLEGGRQNQMQI